MNFYHGSTKQGLQELLPFASPHSNLHVPCVYLTTSRQLALHYIWNHDKFPIRTPMLNIQEDRLIFQEMFSGALELFYKGLSGYIYHCVGTYEMCEDHGGKTCAISREPVPISDVEFIEDVYEKIIEYQGQGKFIYEKYEDLPQHRHDIIRGLIMREIKRDDLLNRAEHPHHALYQDKYPRYWKEAEVLSQHGLL